MSLDSLGCHRRKRLLTDYQAADEPLLAKRVLSFPAFSIKYFDSNRPE
jgi:hypothetical protein